MCQVNSRLIMMLVCYVASSLAAGSEPTTTVAGAVNFAEQCRIIRQDVERKLASLHEKAASEVDLTKGLAGQSDLVKDVQAQSETILRSAIERVFALVEPHAAESAAAEHLAWVATMRMATDTGRSALELLTQHHLVRAETIEVTKRLSRNGNPLAKSLLRAQLSSADLPQDVKWKVMLSLARQLQREAAMASRLSLATDEELPEILQIYGKERVAELKKLDATALEEEANGLFSEIERKYPEQEVIPGLTAAEIANSSVFEMRTLRVGKLAPDIIGKDLNGEALSLSNYRGKVVLLSFWATWCGPCMAKIPHERKLVELYSDKPFAIVGVNADIDEAELKRSLDKFGISWHSFSCGTKGPLGPIPKAWNVSSWPTVYLIDHTGVIRGKHLSDAAIETKLAELVPEAEKAMLK